MIPFFDCPPIDKNQTSLIVERDLLFNTTMVELFKADALNNAIRSINEGYNVENFNSSTTTQLSFETDNLIAETIAKETLDPFIEESYDVFFENNNKKSVKMLLKFTTVKKHIPQPFLD